MSVDGNVWSPPGRGLLPAGRWLLTLVLGCASVGCGGPGAPPEAALPNVVLITADDLGWRDLSSYGNPNLRTPHIDRLAREGVRFTRAFVAASSCSSSRASIMTGQYPHTNGVTALAHTHLDATLSPFRGTLADLLSSAGYVTGIAGKWHVAPYLSVRWYGYHERMGSVLDPWLRETNTVVDFIERHRERPFFLEINFMQTHRDDDGEFQFDPAFPVDPDSVQLPEYLELPDWAEVRLELAKFYSQTMAMDAMVGDVMSTLDRLELATDTIVVFVSDNGPPFPGSKMTLYDRGIATPLIFRWPAKLPAGAVRHGMVSTIDIAPTLLEATGQAIPEWIEGRSFLPVATGDAPDSHRDAIFAEMTEHLEPIPTRAVRTERYKYIRNYSDIAIGLDQLHHKEWAHRLCEEPDQPWKRPRVPEELYDLELDPNEQRNLVDDPAHRAVLDELREVLDTQMEQSADPMLGAPFVRDHDPRSYDPG